MQKKLKCELYNDSMQGWKCYPIQKAQLIIADIPYNVGNNFYGSNPMWYVGGGRIKMENPNLRARVLLRVIITSMFMNTSISVLAL
jgi:hypothetical protein